MVRDNRASQGDADKAESRDLDEALSSIQLIESLLGEEEKKAPPENTVHLPLGRLLDLLPEEFRQTGIDPQVRENPVPVVIDDLFGRLARGKVCLSVAQLVFGVPANLVKQEAYDAEGAEVVLPLPDIVAAIDPQVMEKHTSQSYRHYDVARMADPFELSKSPVSAARHAAGAVPGPADENGAAEPMPGQVVEAPATVVAGARPPAGKPPNRPPVAVESPPAETIEDTSELEVEPEQLERLGGVNLNTATVEQLMTLDGVSPQTAGSIVEYRTLHGPFRTIFRLCNVPGLDRSTFMQVTGMPWSEKHLHRNRKLAALAGVPFQDVGHLPMVVQGLAGKLGSSICVISDQDGLVLAESGEGDEGESFGAIIPGLISHMREAVKTLRVGEIESVSLCFGKCMFMVAVSGSVFLTCMYQSNRPTTAQSDLFDKAATELAWLLSHRGYVGSLS